MRPVNTGGVACLLHLPRPDAPPAALYLHGGAYVAGSAYGYRPLSGALAAATGAGVLVPEYRLAPEHPFPAALADALRAYLWIIDGGVPPEQVTVIGDSSGGGLALSLLLSLREQGLAMPGGVALLCPTVDPTCSTLKDMWSADKRQVILTAEQARHLVELYLDGHPIDDPVVNPLLADLTGLPPLLIQVGTEDIVVDEVHRFTERARDHGVDVRLELYSADTHVFHLFWSFLPEAADAISQVGRFAKDVRTRVTPGRRSGTTR
jgi:epsilon-lactone hydrolase